MLRYLIGFLVTVGLIVLVVVLIFSGGSTPASKSLNLTNYVNNDSARAQLIIEGPVVSDADHREIEIDVTRQQVAMTIYEGYQRTITATKSYTNNGNAFAQFLYGLQHYNFAAGNTNPALADERGYCVDQNRYVYTFDNDNKRLFRFWSSDCGQGTFKGNVTATMYLFENQVPDYNALIENLPFVP